MRGHEFPKPLGAFASEKVKQVRQQDTHFTEGSEGQSGMESRRSNK